MESPNCPKCKGINTYTLQGNYVCSDCFYEWNSEFQENTIDETIPKVIKDANGNELYDGDSVVTIKNLPLKGTSQTIKAGTKIKKIKLTSGDHNIDCKIDGFGSVALKSEFVKKVL